MNAVVNGLSKTARKALTEAPPESDALVTKNLVTGNALSTRGLAVYYGRRYEGSVKGNREGYYLTPEGAAVAQRLQRAEDNR